MKLTPEIVRAAYDYLVITPPFNQWNLPDGDDVSFKVNRSRDTYGHYLPRAVGWKRLSEIAISAHRVFTTGNLMLVMAHEMVHLHMGETGMDRGVAAHGKAFQRLAKQVCKAHGFDEGMF